MLFRKDHPRRCDSCEHAVRLNASDLLCRHAGVVSAGHVCRRYRYDPTKRIPPPPADLQSGLDFSLGGEGEDS